MTEVLRASNVETMYGRVMAIRGISLTVKEGNLKGAISPRLTQMSSRAPASPIHPKGAKCFPSCRSRTT